MKTRHPLLAALLLALPVAAANVDAFHAHVRQGAWTESWPDAAGTAHAREVKGEIWNDAIAAALAQHGAVHLPKREAPYYLDGPVVLKSGQRLSADADAEIRLQPGSNTCMVRNENIAGFADRPVPGDLQPDADITIEGGIWTTLAVGPGETNGNRRGLSAKQNPVPGTHGVILLHNARRVTVRNVTVRQSQAFAVHLGNVREFTVDGVTLDRHRRDGVHVNGPASEGLIRNVGGTSHDDTVALNAWEWLGYTPSFGPIHHVTIERVTGTPRETHSADSIRLLPGVKRFADGTTLDCPIHDIVVRDVADIREFKFYDQPNLERPPGEDTSASIGTLRNIRLERLVFNRPGKIEIHANADGVVLHDAKLHHPFPPDDHLVAIGPKSVTYRGDSPTDPARWREIFSPDRDCTVRNLTVTGVRLGDATADLPIERLVRVTALQPNPDYPKTTPRGGTGKGLWIR